MYIIKYSTAANTKRTQLPSATLPNTEEKKINSSPRERVRKHRTTMMLICHIKSIMMVTKTVVIIMTPSSAMPA
ncbi:Os07g0509300, partial [Oryza sativa Japonica Group]